MYFVIKKIAKSGDYFHRTAVLTWLGGARKADVARGTRADATLHARPRRKAARAYVRHRWRTGRRHVAWATRVHADAWVGPCGRGLVGEGLTRSPSQARA